MPPRPISPASHDEGERPMNKRKLPPVTGGGGPFSEPVLQAYRGPKPGVNLT